jgi:hypothetical protein
MYIYKAKYPICSIRLLSLRILADLFRGDPSISICSPAHELGGLPHVLSMSGLASVPSIWASVDDRRAAAADASDEDLAYHQMEAACSSPTPNQTRRTPPKPNRPPPSDFVKIALRVRES